MTDFTESRAVSRLPIVEAAQDRHHRLVEQLISRLPERFANATRWLRRPSSRWLRIPAGVLLIGGGFLAFLPVFGLWMAPLGLLLLAEDIPALKRGRNRVLDYMHRRWPHWFSGEAARREGDRPPAADDVRLH